MSRKVRILLVVAPVFILLDQVTKGMVRAWIPRGDEIAIIPGFLRLIHVANPGAAWGLLGGHEYRLPIFLAVSVVAFVVIALYYRTLTDREGWLAGALALILAGAGGNFIDRLVLHEVTDFIDVYIGWQGALRDLVLEHAHTNHYPTFNVADIAIVVGVGLFLVHVVIVEPRRERQRAAAGGEGGGGRSRGKGGERRAATG